MKRFLILVLTLTMIISNSTISATANNIHSTEIIYVNEDIYIEVTITEEPISSTYATTQTKSASKTHTIKNTNGDTIATFKLNATFSYNGSTSSCTSVSHSTTISDDSWKFTETSSSKSGNKATGSFTIKDYLLFVNVQTISKTITLTCDANGNLS